MKVIIVGAGMAGLMAARELRKQNVQVTVVEALAVAGGRTQTLRPANLDCEVEAGAEFIHGELPITMQLLKEAGIGRAKANLTMYRFTGKQMRKGFGEGADWEQFFNEINALEKDCTVGEVLRLKFSAKHYERLRSEVNEMAGGLDLADVDQLSVFGIREEWQSTEAQFRPKGGYGKLVNFLVEDLEKSGVAIHYDTAVERIDWRRGKVSVHSKTFNAVADAVVITVSLGSLLSEDIAFSPDIPEVRRKFETLGFGSVVKMPMQFKSAFWMERKPDMGFLFTPSGYTFWTPSDPRTPLLTAWMNHDLAEQTKHLTDEELIALARAELARVFNRDQTDSEFVAAGVFRYTSNTFNKGAYSWPTVTGMAVIPELIEGVEDTLWFAGEAFATDGNVGTVEAALWSGKHCADNLGSRYHKNV